MSQTSASVEDGKAECIALWQEALRSPSIIGFNVHPALADTIVISVEGSSALASAADIRLWQDHDGAGTEEEQKIFLEIIFPGVPTAWNLWQTGEACATTVEAHLRDQRVQEFRKKLVERKNTQTLRRRRGQAGESSDVLEDGDVKEDSWREYLKRPGAGDLSVHLHSVADVGSKGRRVLAVRLSMSSLVAHELGELAYPSIFSRPKDALDLEAEDLSFKRCYMGCVAFIAVLMFLWLTFLLRGLSKQWSAN